MNLEKAVKSKVIIRGMIWDPNEARNFPGLWRKGGETSVFTLAVMTWLPKHKKVYMNVCQFSRDNKSLWTYDTDQSSSFDDLAHAFREGRYIFPILNDDDQCEIQTRLGLIEPGRPHLLQMLSFLRGLMEGYASRTEKAINREGHNVLSKRLHAFIVEQNKKTHEAMGVPPLR